MRSSIATVCISGSLREKLTAIARAEFDGFELFENDLVTSMLSPEEVRSRADDLGLTIDLYQPFRDFEGVTATQLHANLSRAERKFELMHRLGVDTMLLCSNVATAVTGKPAVLVDQLGELAELAQRHGVRVAYEALAWGTYVSTYDVAWELVREVGHSALGVCLDSFHILSRGTPLDAIATIPADRIFFCQLADAPRMQLDVLSWSRHYRVFPGEGDWDVADFVGRLVAAGYDGPLSLEVFNDVFRQGDPGLTARDARRSLLLLEDEVRRRRDDVAGGSEPEASARALGAPVRVELAELPPAQQPHGFSFVELGPGPDEAVDDALAAIGFRRRGRHRRKDSTLWTQGDVRIVVNDDRAGREAAIVAVGLEVDDVDTEAARMTALHNRIVPRDRADDEDVLVATLAPDGTEFYFSDRPAGRSSWEDEFGRVVHEHAGGEARGPGAGEVAGIGITAVDHVALIQPWDRFDEAALFFRSVLGLRIDTGLDLPSETGLVRSRSVVSDDRRVRLAINIAPVQPTGESAFVNHIAFATSDLLATVRAMRERGARLLPIPANYYDDLGARFDIPAARLTEFAENMVLYDRDGEGEFFHAYTAPVGAFVFELVQRVGGYNGYGAANAHVRLAATRALTSLAPQPASAVSAPDGGSRR
ncbi:MAG: sugar phosphate isomerase/epimerase and 4-hydroxyphenylpyruvate protein [Agromyces sp.]|jgi:4-hydroxyphenylpyruvate dioxygenase|nr:sugar phosphate isomerase/epimerase and 4-hydroxyphenylpyruvate protein [Agromyces sp.]